MMLPTLGRAVLLLLLALLPMPAPRAAQAQAVIPPVAAPAADRALAAPPQPAATPQPGPPLPSSSPARAVCAYLAIGPAGDRVIDPGFAVPAPTPSSAQPPSLLTQVEATAAPGATATSASCHPIPPLVPIGASPG